jgi:hypothetical protein
MSNIVRESQTKGYGNLEDISPITFALGIILF